MYVTFHHVCTLCLISLQCRSYPNIQIAQVAAMQRGMKVLDFYAAESYKGLLESMHANLEHTHYWLPSWEVTRYNVNQLLSLHLVLHYTEEKHSLDKVGLLFPSPEFAGDAPAAAGSVFPDSIFSGLKETMIAYVEANGSIDFVLCERKGQLSLDPKLTYLYLSPDPNALANWGVPGGLHSKSGEKHIYSMMGTLCICSNYLFAAISVCGNCICGNSIEFVLTCIVCSPCTSSQLRGLVFGFFCGRPLLMRRRLFTRDTTQANSPKMNQLNTRYLSKGKKGTR